jgi:alpha-beta hydrolase superfamily lysophospholipase
MNEGKPVNKRRKIFKWIQVTTIVYCLVGIIAYTWQEKLLFHPAALKADAAFNFPAPYKEVNIPVNPSTKYNIVQFTVPGNNIRGVVLYFHGNKDNITHYASAANTITKHGYEVWMIDYPGFGKSTGKINEEVLYDQALQVYKMARVRFSPDSIIIYGRSLGSGIATQLATIRDCKRLILETPYYSIPSLVSTYLWMYPLERMMKYKFPNNEYLKKVTAPVTIFHGTNDGVIPYKNAVRLKEVLKAGDEFVSINNGSHNNLKKYKEMTVKLDSVLSL